MTVPAVALGDLIAPSWGNQVRADLNYAAGRVQAEDAGWATFVPVFTGITLGNGVLVGRQLDHGQTRIVRISLVLGTTTVIGATPGFNLPASLYDTEGCRGIRIQYLDASAGSPAGLFEGIPIPNTSVNVRLGYANVVSASVRAASIGAAVPFTWTTSDRIDIHALYERDNP